MISSGSIWAICAASPSRRRPASASTSASQPPCRSFCSRVSTLPRISCHLQIAAEVQQLRPPPQTARADRRPLGQLVERRAAGRNQDVARRRPLGHRRQTQPRRCDRRQVFEAVYGQIDAAIQQGKLDFLGEKPLPADRLQRLMLSISRRGDGNHVHFDPALPQFRGNPLGLPAGQCATTVPSLKGMGGIRG